MAERVWQLVVHGAPRTKKTHNVLAMAGRRRIVLPSKAWARWTRGARIETWVGNCWISLVELYPTITVPVNCRALFYREADRGDAVGFYQGLADLLEKRHVIANDRQIVSWDGSRLLKDVARPRVELTLEELATVEPAPLQLALEGGTRG